MNEVQQQPVFVEPGQGVQQRRVITDVVTFKVTGSATGGAYSLFETLTAPGGGTPPHWQEHEDEAFFILEGTYTFLVGERQVEAKAGATAFVPRGTVHAYTNSGDSPARMLILVTPADLHERFFMEAGNPLDMPAGPPDFARIGAAAARHGIHILPPAE